MDFIPFPSPSFDPMTIKAIIAVRTAAIPPTVFNAAEKAVGFLSHIIPKAIIEAAIIAIDVAKFFTATPIAFIFIAFPKSPIALLSPFEKIVKAVFNSFPLLVASKSFEIPSIRTPAIKERAIAAVNKRSVSAKLSNARAPAKIAIAPAVLINALAFKSFW